MRKSLCFFYQCRHTLQLWGSNPCFIPWQTAGQKYTQTSSLEAVLVKGTHLTLIKKENRIFLIYKLISEGSVAKSYMTITASSYMVYGISSYIRKLFLIYDFATDPILIFLFQENCREYYLQNPI